MSEGKNTTSEIGIQSEPLPCRARRVIAFILIAAAGLALDLGTKQAVFGWLGLPGARETYWIIPSVFGFQTSLNEGALFGLGEGLTVLFVIISLAAALTIFVWIVREAYKSRLLVWALGGITAGIFGNLWDRLACHGICWPGYAAPELADQPIHAVRDWILVMIGSYPWPNFNFADVFLVCGVGLIFVYTVFLQPKELKEKEEVKETNEADESK